MAWKGRHSVRRPNPADLEELIEDLESAPMRALRINKRDIPTNAIEKKHLSAALQTEISAAARYRSNPIYMAGAIPAAAADLTDDWSFKRIGLHAGTSITSDGDVTVGAATFYLVGTSGGDVTVGLPAAATCTNMVLSFKKIFAANAMILDANGSETIDGATTKTYSDRYSWVTIISNGTSWFIISSGNP